MEVNNLLLGPLTLADISDCHPVYGYGLRVNYSLMLLGLGYAPDVAELAPPVNFRIHLLVKCPQVLPHWRSWAFHCSALGSDATGLHTQAPAAQYPVQASCHD